MEPMGGAKAEDVSNQFGDPFAQPASPHFFLTVIVYLLGL